MPSLIDRAKNVLKGGWGRIAGRVRLWVNRGNASYARGQELALVVDEEPRYTWRLGATEQHCTDCLRLDGVTLTASEWDRLGIHPQSPDLECGGWHCDCRRVPTDKPSDGLEGFRP